MILLAAGASRRMGRPKLLLPWGDTSVLGHHLRTWKALGAHQIGVVIDPASTALTDELDRLQVPIADRIANAEPERGMFSSVLCAAQWTGWQTGLTHWASVLGDQPHLPEPLLAALVDFAKRNPDSICQPEYCEKPRHPILLPRRALQNLAGSAGPTLRDFLGNTQTDRKTMRCDAPELECDIDTADDYATLRPIEPLESSTQLSRNGFTTRTPS